MVEKIHCALGADHRGFKLKEYIKNIEYFLEKIVWHDVGAHSEERTDYPIFTKNAIELLQDKTVSCAILICGTGVGMAIAANRFPHCYAGVVWCPELARRVKEEDNVNILVLPADFIDNECALTSIQAWLEATFKGGRYAERISMIEKSGAK